MKTYAYLISVILGLAGCQPAEVVQSPTQSPSPIAAEFSYPKLSLLVARYRQTGSAQLLASLDSLCCHADGALSAECGVAATTLWEQRSQPLSTYLVGHPHSCLERALIAGYSEAFSVYEPSARTHRLNELQQAWQLTAQHCPRYQVAYMQTVLARINPSQFE